jgi:hypothetical protein
VAGSIDPSGAVAEIHSGFSCNDNFIAIEQSSNQATYYSLAISITVCRSGIDEIPTSVKEGSALIGGLNLIGVPTPRHCSKA